MFLPRQSSLLQPASPLLPSPAAPPPVRDPSKGTRRNKRQIGMLMQQDFFCEIAANEALDGNRPTKSLSPMGYKNLIEELHKQTGRLYTKKQMKNRWDDLKSIWTAWVYYMQKAFGLGWDPVKQTITASEEEWDSMIKVHKDIRRFRRGPPDNLELLEKMFQRASVEAKMTHLTGCP